MPPFIVYAIPRSRTFWLSRFLGYGEWTCDHDVSVRMRGLDDIRSALSTPFYGSVETAAAPWWRLVHDMRPDIRTVVVRRPVGECMASLVREGGPAFGAPEVLRVMRRLDAKLDQIEQRVPGVLSIPVDALDTADGCKAVFEHCLQTPFDPEWHRWLAPQRLLVNFRSQVRYCQANAPQIARVMNTATQRIRMDLATSSKVSADSMTYQEEPLDVVLRDGRYLISQHHIAVGLPGDEIDRMNLDMMRLLERGGCLHVMTARSNGRMFGYLMTITGPGFESADKVETHTTAFYADPCSPGVGAKLQRAVIQAARERGSAAVYSRAGTRGSGPRLGALYKRLGAEHFGDLYALELK